MNFAAAYQNSRTRPRNSADPPLSFAHSPTTTCISLFHRSGQSWTQYIHTLPPLLRRHYRTPPPPPHSNTTTHPIPFTRSTSSSPQPYHSRKRHRTTPPPSDSDPEGYSRNNQPYEPPAPTPAEIPQKPSTIAQSISSAEETTHHPRSLGEYKPTPHLPAANTASAAYSPADRVRAWYQEHLGPRHPNAFHRTRATTTTTTSLRITDTRKDPAGPHPDNAQPLGKPFPPPTSPAKQRSLTTITRLGGYTNPTSTPAPKPPLPPRRPSLKSILKTHREANLPARSQQARPNPTPNNTGTSQPTPRPNTNNKTVNDQPPNPQYMHPFQPILSPRHTVIPRPYIPAPRPRDADGHPCSWCAGCTAQLSKDDLNYSPGLRDPDIPNARYRLRVDQD